MEEKIMQEMPNQEDIRENAQAGADTASENEDAVDNEKVVLQNQLDELKDKYLRLVADFDNFRKRTAKERLELIQTASKDVITGLLSVLDDSERAEIQIRKSQDMDAIKEGIDLVFGKLRANLHAKGVRPMQTIGTDFNPEFHEAITEIPAPTPDLVGKVLDEVEKGYYLNDKIIRFAKVVVGK